jgi:hypothetical protein
LSTILPERVSDEIHGLLPATTGAFAPLSRTVDNLSASGEKRAGVFHHDVEIGEKSSVAPTSPAFGPIIFVIPS